MMERFAHAVAPTTGLLAPGVRLVFWDNAEAGRGKRTTVECGGREIRPPILRMVAPLDAGGQRLFAAFRWPADAEAPLRLRHADGTVLATADTPAGERDADALADASVMVSGLSDTGRVRLARFLLLTCRTGFSLGADPDYARLMRRLCDALSPDPGPLEACASFDRQLFLAEGRVSAQPGEELHAVTIGGGVVQEPRLPPRVPGVGPDGADGFPLFAALGAAALAEDSRVVIVGEAGVAIRRLAARRLPSEPLATWLAARGIARGPLWDYALDGLTMLGASDEDARRAVREILVLRAGPDSPAAPALALARAVAAGDRLFLSGRLRDPHGLVRAVSVSLGGWTATVDRARLIAPQAGDAERFVALAAGRDRVPPCGVARLALVLGSGARIDAPPQALVDSGNGAAAAILDAVPPDGVGGAMIEQVIGPALDALEPGDEAVAAPSPESFGAAAGDARASVILARPGDRALFHAALHAFASWLPGAGIELVVVLPDPAEGDETATALAALERRFGVSSRLVRCPAGTASHRAAGLGAAAASAGWLVFLDGACLPQNGHAMTRLVEAAPPGITGGPVLNFDGSVHHAGFEPPAAGGLVHPHRGFPAATLRDGAMRPAFACSSAFLAVDRGAFDRLGGFAAGWLTRDWRDVDFCLRARAAGIEVRLADHMRAVRYGAIPPASAARDALLLGLDARRFARDWPQHRAAPMDAAPEPPPARSAAPNPRWAA